PPPLAPPEPEWEPEPGLSLFVPLLRGPAWLLLRRVCCQADVLGVLPGIGGLATVDLVIPGPSAQVGHVDGDGRRRPLAQPPAIAHVVEHAADQLVGHLSDLVDGGL